MMISPEIYASEHEEDTFEELIAERKRLIKKLNEIESIAYDKEHSDAAWSICPRPDVVYQMYLEYLAQICILTEEKYHRVIVWKKEE